MSLDKTTNAQKTVLQPSQDKQNGKVRVPDRPARQNMRRRSTLHWASADPRARQQKLEGIEVDRLVDSWFSLHHEQSDGPLYISEVRERSMNPDFSHFDLQPPIFSITRASSFVLKVWSKTELMDEYCVLVETNVDLGSLQYLGKSLEYFHRPLPENCILIHLSDGIYTNFTDMPADRRGQPVLTPAMKTMQAANTASFDALTKLVNVDEVLQDALRTRARLEADIGALLANLPPAEQALAKLPAQREDTRTVKRAVNVEQKSIESLKRNKTNRIASQRSRRRLMEAGLREEDLLRGRHEEMRIRIEQIQKQSDRVESLTQGQIRRVSTDLLHIFPIDPVANRTLQFTIRSIHLPNSNFSDTNRDEIAAGLGYAAQLVHQLSLYLTIPLPYTIETNGSTSSIHDDISASIAQRIYPLYPEGPSYKFDYGVFLLNKNIEFLLNRYSLRVMEIRHTLPNLKYLLFVLTAGSGELPSRKTGGIRGLLRSSTTADSSRRNSDDSFTSQASNASPADVSGKTEIHDEISSPLRAKALPYRRSMLRNTA